MFTRTRPTLKYPITTQLPPNHHPFTDQSPPSFHRCDNDPRIIASIAALFASDRKVDKARSWFNRACTLDPDIGDHWAAYYRFEAQHGGDEMAAAVAELDAIMAMESE